MNGDLISRSALLEDLKEQHDYIMQDPEVGKNMKWCEAVCFHRTVETVESAPAVDAVKVIRCKDCFYWMKAKVTRSGNLVCPKSGMEITATDFCSKAEKRRCKYDR